jgi:hypothetical protein
MTGSRLAAWSLPGRVALTAALATGLVGLALSLVLVARVDGRRPGSAFSPEAVRLRTCAPALERAIETTMRSHLPDPAERRALLGWIHAGARMEAYAGEPARILDERCGTCHGASPQAGIRLQTFADARALAEPGGRDPYRRAGKHHVHVLAVGALLVLLLLGLTATRLPPAVQLGVGLVPLAAHLASAVLVVGGLCAAPLALWLLEGLVLLGLLAGSALLLWDLWAPPPEPGPQGPVGIGSVTVVPGSESGTR